MKFKGLQRPPSPPVCKNGLRLWSKSWTQKMSGQSDPLLCAKLDLGSGANFSLECPPIGKFHERCRSDLNNSLNLFTSGVGLIHFSDQSPLHGPPPYGQNCDSSSGLSWSLAAEEAASQGWTPTNTRCKAHSFFFLVDHLATGQIPDSSD